MNIFIILLFLFSSLYGAFSLEINSSSPEIPKADKIITYESIAYIWKVEESKIQLLDCSNATEPHFVNEVQIYEDSFSMSYYVQNNILYYCVNSYYLTYLKIIDVSDPQNLVPLGHLNLECSFILLDNKIYVENDLIYILGFNLFCNDRLLEHIGRSALFIINCSDYSLPKLEQSHYFTGAPYINIFVENETTFLLKNYKTNNTGFDIVKAADNTTLLLIGGWNDSLLNETIIIDSFILNNDSLCFVYNEGLMMFNIANKSSPELKSTIQSDIFINDACLSNTNLYLIGNNTIEIYNIDVMGNLELLNLWNFVDDIGGSFFDGDMSNNLLYILRSSSFEELYFFIIDVEDGFHPVMLYPHSDWKDKYLQIPLMGYLKWLLIFSSSVVLVVIILVVRRIKSRTSHYGQ
ncbi:MAG: hypothetical protein GNW80_17395, partial [Asgard group archaeon]|nr:hypothetical protein [Asgard group archaeon]